MANANVVVEGTSRGTTTRNDGAFVIAGVAAGPQRVRAARIGYVAQVRDVSVTAGGTTTVQFVLATAATTLSEMVVVGYGTQRREAVTGSVATVTAAEARLLRAYFYYVLMDTFGGVPLVTDAEVKPRERATRAETFAFIEKELTEARADLPVSWPASDYGRATKGAADALLASMYLNAEVWTGTVTAAGLQKAQPQWQKAVEAADRVLAGPYRLATDQAANFRADNHTSPEMVLVSARRPEAGVSLNFISDRLHYNQFSPSPNNGRAVEPPTFRRFDPDDRRASVFLQGPQVHLVTGQPVNDRGGQRLTYLLEIPDITQATEGMGVRVYKWPFDPARVTTNHGNDFPLFRLAEIYLIKAEALNELGRTGEAIGLVNQIRARVFTPPKPLSEALSQVAARQAIFDERLFELLDERKRRADMIRAGTWLTAGRNKDQDAPFRVLMPIPQTQVDANPLLVQNPGY